MRLAAVVAVIALALGVAYLQRRGRAIRRVARSFEGLDEGVYLFGSETCSSCETMRHRLTAAGIEFSEFGAEGEAKALAQYSIDKVPAVARVEADGSGWLAVGVIAPARIRRWLSSP
jgi:hypothetical protein